MKLVKIVGALVLVLLLAVAGGVWYLASNLDDLVKTAIEKAGSHATQTKVSVSKISLGELLEGKASIEGLSIGNPAGFTDPTIFSLGKVSAHVNIDQTSEKKVVMEEIFIGAPRVTLEIDKNGNTNVEALQKNLERLMGEEGAAPAETSGGQADAPKVLVKKLTVAEGGATARIAALGNEAMSVVVPTFTMTDIGEEEPAGVPASVAMERFFKKWIAVINKAVADSEIGKRIEELKAKAQEEIDKARKQAEEEADKAVEQAKGEAKKELEKNLGEDGKKLGEDLDKQIDTSAIKSLF